MEPERTHDKSVKVLWAVLAAFWAVGLMRALVALRRGVPDYYPREHAMSAVLSALSLLATLSLFVRERRLRRAVLLVVVAVLVFALAYDFSH
jgi:multisubunit Na+/H+ antiporter MnhE subunit